MSDGEGIQRAHSTTTRVGSGETEGWKIVNVLWHLGEV